MQVNRVGQWFAAALVAAFAPFVANDVRAGEFLLPLNGDNVIGAVSIAVAEHEDTLLDIGRRYGVGYEEIIAANPGIDPWLPGAGTEVVIPGRFVLPDAPREGIVVNLPEHRLYYYPPAKPGQPRVVRTFPISTGKMDWKTPLGATKVVAKQERPNWYPPQSVRLEHEAKGDPAAAVHPARPGQPAGRVCVAARHPRRLVPDPRHQPSCRRRHAGHARLHPHVPGGHRRVLHDDPGEHEGEPGRPDDEGRLVAGHAVRRAPGAARRHRRSFAHGSGGTRSGGASRDGWRRRVDRLEYRTARVSAGVGVPVRVGERNFSRVPMPAPESAPALVEEPVQSPAP